MAKKFQISSLPDQTLAAKRGDIARLVASSEVPSGVSAFAKGRKFYIRTYGCQANIRDEEIMAGFLEKAGFIRTENPEEANLAIINTCAVRENAEEKVYGEIGSYKKNYEKDKSFLLVIAGCVMQENGVASSLLETYPWISLMMGTHEVPNLLHLLNEVIEKKRGLIMIRSIAGEVVEGMPSVRLSPYKAYVNISYGCDKFCTYCIVPYTRGRERSRRPEDIIRECACLVEEGYKEITLLGQNVNSYGLDLKDGTSFASLLEEVAKLGIPRLRFITSYPSQFTEEMIDVMSRYQNIVHWLHFPVQSGSTSCLRRMGRRYGREEYLALCRAIKEKIPDMALTTDIIVGFPGETEEEFQDTLSLCEEVSYSSAFTFIYSPRVGTPAAKMEQVPSEVSHERFDRLKKVIDESTAKHSDSMVGNVYEVLVDGPSKRNPKMLSGYAGNGKLIHFEGPEYLTGCFVPVKILESKVYSLRGELVGDPLVHKAKDVAYLLSLDPLLKEYRKLELFVQNDPEIQELGKELTSKKKAMALAMQDQKAHEKAKKEYLAVLERLENHPALKNKDALLEEVRGELLLIRESLLS